MFYFNLSKFFKLLEWLRSYSSIKFVAYVEFNVSIELYYLLVLQDVE